MTNDKIIKIVEVKENNKWVQTYSTEDIATVYQDLSESLIAKKLNCCTYIRSIKRINLYNGFQKITVYHTNDVKVTFIVED